MVGGGAFGLRAQLFRVKWMDVWMERERERDEETARLKMWMRFGVEMVDAFAG
jgi:hypothetical protein